MELTGTTRQTFSPANRRGSSIIEYLLEHSSGSAWTILAISIAITVVGSWLSSQYVESKAEDRFSFAVEDARNRILDRLEDYELALHSGVAFFDALGRKPTRTEWAKFVGTLELPTKYPGIQGIGFAEMLEPTELNEHISAVRAEGFPDYNVNPSGDRSRYSAIVYLEPFDWRNRRAFGYDMYSNAMRRQAMDQARDSGKPAYSGKVTLVQETREDVQNGFLVYLPVYRTHSAPQTIGARREALLGYVYSPFRVNDLMNGILGRDIPDLNFRIFDPSLSDDEALLFDSNPDLAPDLSRRRQTIQLNLEGRVWQVAFGSTTEFDNAVSNYQPFIIAISGLAVDILLFLIIHTLTNQRTKVRLEAERVNAELIHSTLRLETAKAAGGIGVFEHNPNTGWFYMDKKARSILELRLDEPATMSAFTKNIAPADRDKVAETFSRNQSSAGSGKLRFRLGGPNNEGSTVETNFKLVRDGVSSGFKFIGSIQDVSDRVRDADDARITMAAFEYSRDGVLVTDKNQRIVQINPACSRITGYTANELVGKTPRILRSGEQDNSFYQEMWHCLNSRGFWEGRLWNRCKDGGLFLAYQTISAVPDNDGNVTHYISVMNDITEMTQQQKKIEQLALKDHLTGLPNRNQLHEEVREAMAAAHLYGHSMAVCYLDLDGFKPVNDRLGREAGDELLVQVAQKLKQLIRKCDSIARIGGDEFVIMLNELKSGREICEELAERILVGISGTYTLCGSSKVYVSASIGIALYPVDDADADSLLRHADHAMLAAKEKGRNRFEIFDNAKSKIEFSKRRQMERFAFAIEDNELELYYQPKVDMRRGTVVGVEALVRWHHPDKGMLFPGDFLPLIEGTEQAIALDQWVINESLRQLGQWQKAGYKMPISINIDGTYLQDQELIRYLETTLQKFPDIPPELLELEILESTALTDLENAARVVERARSLGVKVALDDFGTGYSSLTYLKQLPADTLKIDKSFIIDMPTDRDSRALVEGVVGLAKAFNRKVIAEGVESESHGLMLLRMGCDFGQGYGIAKPMPAKNLMQWAKEFRQPDAWKQEAANVFWLKNTKQGVETSAAG